MTETIHVFEMAGLGLAPFKVVGFEQIKFQAAPGEPVKAGGSCDYCSSPIMNAYWVQGSGSEDSRFKVGCECVKKTGDERMMDKVKKMELARKRKERRAKEAEVIANATELLNSDKGKTVLSATPHPYPRFAEEGKTMWHYYNFLIVTSRMGNAGKVKQAKKLIKELA